MITANERYIDFGGHVFSYDQIDKMPHTKENSFLHAVGMYCRSWTWARMTEEERQKVFKCLFGYNAIGNFGQRMEQYSAIYSAFLEGIGYKPIGWREEA